MRPRWCWTRKASKFVAQSILQHLKDQTKVALLLRLLLAALELLVDALDLLLQLLQLELRVVELDLELLRRRLPLLPRKFLVLLRLLLRERRRPGSHGASRSRRGEAALQRQRALSTEMRFGSADSLPFNNA